MERFRIAQYGFIQMVTLAFGILGAGTVLKLSNQAFANGRPHTLFFDIIALYRDYGLLLSLIIVGWTVFCAYHSIGSSRRNIDEGTIVGSGLLLSGIFFALGTFILFGGLGSLL